MNRSAHQVISAGVYNLLLFMNIDAFWEKTHVLCTYPIFLNTYGQLLQARGDTKQAGKMRAEAESRAK